MVGYSRKRFIRSWTGQRNKMLSCQRHAFTIFHPGQKEKKRIKKKRKEGIIYYLVLIY